MLSVKSVMMTFASCCFTFPVHRLNRGKLLGSLGVSWKQFNRVRLVPELCHDPRGSILRSENCIISFIEIEDLPHLFQDDSADCSSDFQGALGEFGDDFPIFSRHFVSIGAL